MEYRRLGRTGLKVSPLWLGTANFGREIKSEQCFAIMDRALQAGVTSIDTANAYSRGAAEAIVGDWIGQRGVRHDIVLGTKVWGKMGDGPNDSGLSRRHILEQIDASLHRLRTDYVDLYQAHFPDPNVPMDEVLRALDDVVRAGKARYIGCSNYAGWQMVKAAWISDRLGLHSFVSAQPRYNIFVRDPEAEQFPACLDLGMGAITYSPTAGGFLTGRYRRDSAIEPGSRFATVAHYKNIYWTEANFRFVDAFAAYCKQRGVGMAEMSIAWVAGHPAVTAPIIGVHTLDHLEQALRSLDIKLTAEERAEIAGLGSRE